MGKIGFITDSTCDIPQEFLEEHEIELIATRIIYSDREYRDRLEISADEIYAGFENEIPKTSMPSPEDFFKSVEILKSKGCDKIICIFVSSGLSGTHNMVLSLSEEIKDIDITVIDSKSLSLGLGYVVMDTVMAVKNGAGYEEAIDLAKKTIDNIDVYFVINTLHYLRLGGRIGLVEGTIAEILNLKPLIHISHDDGKYRTHKKIKGFAKSISAMNKIITNYEAKSLRIAIMHGNLYEEMEKMKEKISTDDKVKYIDYGQISPVLSVHTGPGLIGVVIQKLD